VCLERRLQLSQKSPKAADESQPPLGKVIADRGLYLKLAPCLAAIEFTPVKMWFVISRA
jgi:hypothetical protein